MATTSNFGRDQAPRAGRLGAALLALGALASLVLPALEADPASAAPVVVAGATLDWKVSTYAWSSGGSLKEVHEAVAPATVGTDGWSFGSGGGTFDAGSGAASIHWGGALVMGNTSFGSFRLKLAKPHLVLVGDGTGTLAADVSGCGPPCTGTYAAPTTGVVVAHLSGVTLGGPSTHVTATVTPDWIPQADDPSLKQFPPTLLDALPDSMDGFFEQTGTTGTNPDKGPAPIAFAFAPQLPATTSTSTSTSTSSTSTTTSTSTTVAPSSTTTSTTSTTVPDAGQAIEAGSLDWGVKASFRTYIAGPVANGSVTPSAGAIGNADGTFRFPLGDGTFDDVDHLAAAFAGSVRFAGHDGALDVTFANPRVTIDGDDGALVVDVLNGGQRTDGVALAALDLAGVTATRDGDDLVLAGIPATLSSTGAPSFGGFYQAGDALDPLTMVLAVDDDRPRPTTSSTAPTTSTSAPEGVVGCLDRATVAAGAPISVCGGGFLAGEQVRVLLHSDPIFVAVLTADAAGRAAGTVTIPASAPAGNHHLELHGASSGRRLLSSPITVTAASSGATLPRTGAAALGLLRWALLVLGVGLVALGRSQLVRAARRA
jgi:hypothetical protein